MIRLFGECALCVCLPFSSMDSAASSCLPLFRCCFHIFGTLFSLVRFLFQKSDKYDEDECATILCCALRLLVLFPLSSFLFPLSHRFVLVKVCVNAVTSPLCVSSFHSAPLAFLVCACHFPSVLFFRIFLQFLHIRSDGAYHPLHSSPPISCFTNAHTGRVPPAQGQS